MIKMTCCRYWLPLAQKDFEILVFSIAVRTDYQQRRVTTFRPVWKKTWV